MILCIPELFYSISVGRVCQEMGITLPLTLYKLYKEVVILHGKYVEK